MDQADNPDKPEEKIPDPYIPQPPTMDSSLRTDEVKEDDDKPANTIPPKVIPPQGGHKYYRGPIIAALVVIIAVLVWLLILKKPTKPHQTTTSTSTNSSQSSTAIPTTPDNVAYAFKAKSSDPYSVYIRPAGGGARISAKTLVSSESISGSDVWGSNVAFSTDKGIYVSTDSGRDYTLVLSLTGGADITSLKISSDGLRIAYGYLSGVGAQNTVKSIDLSGKDSKDLFTSKKSGIYIVAWNNSLQKIVYREGCANCDGTPDLPVLRDLKTDKVTKLLSGLTVNELADIAVSSDFSTAVYAKSTENSAAPSQALGVFTGAPYTISSIDLTTAKVTKIVSLGTVGEKNANGTLKSRVVHVGFVFASNTAFYSADTQLYLVKAASPTLTFEATKPILFVPFVGTSDVITGSGAATSDYSLSDYNLVTKKSTAVFQGDNNTVIFGITTK